ncbi:MAG TPA: iron donor protein CyaY [Casimicrobiaceae bacterium]|jgi:CyaY protein
MSGESEFSALADAVLAAVATALDIAIDASDSDIDWSLNDGVLTIDCGPGGKLIVNRHVPNREIWVAAKSGGFHYRGDGGAWRDSRAREELGAALTRLLRDQAGVAVDLRALPPPPPG